MSRLDRLPTFADGDTFRVVVESPRGAVVKLKYSPKLEAMSVSRPLPMGLSYRYDWGFVPSTQGDDGDPLDAVIVWDVTTFPGVVLSCRALAVIQVEQNRTNGDATHGRVRNDRILAVPVDARRQADVTLASIPQRLRDELEHFVVASTALEGKDATVVGWAGPEAARGLLQSATTRR